MKTDTTTAAPSTHRPVSPAKPIAIRILHWATAALFAISALTAWLAFDFRLSMTIGERDALFAIHRGAGLVAMMLLLVWGVTRARNVLARPEAGILRRAIAMAHVGLGLFCIAIPVMPWVARGLDGRVDEMFALIPGYNLVSTPENHWSYWLLHMHKEAVDVLVWLVSAHVAAALLHEFAFRDGVLRSMLTGRPALRDDPLKFK